VKTFHTPELMQLIGNAGRQMSTPPVTLENAPGSVEVVVRSQDEGRRTLVHLVNFTGEMTRPIRRIVPVTDVRVTVPAGARPAKAYLLSTHQNIQLSRDQAGHVQAVIPRINEYDVLVFE